MKRSNLEGKDEISEREGKVEKKAQRESWKGENEKRRETRKYEDLEKRRESWDRSWRERKERASGADKFYCVSFRLPHLSALFRAKRASCPRFLISRRPPVKEETRTMMYARPVKSLLNPLAAEQWNNARKLSKCNLSKEYLYIFKPLTYSWCIFTFC